MEVDSYSILELNNLIKSDVSRKGGIRNKKYQNKIKNPGITRTSDFCKECQDH